MAVPPLLRIKGPRLKATREPCCTFHQRNYSVGGLCGLREGEEQGAITGIYYFKKKKKKKRKMYISLRMFGLILSVRLYQKK